MRLARLLYLWRGRDGSALSRVDVCLRICATVAVASAIASIAWRVSANHAAVGYSAGDLFAAPVLLEANNSPTPVLVVWVSSNCGACQQSAEFYKRLTTATRNKKIVVLSPDPLNQVKQFLADHGVTPDYVRSTNGDWMKFRGTPTLLLVSSSRRISHVWFGRLPIRDEIEVLSAL